MDELLLSVVPQKKKKEIGLSFQRTAVTGDALWPSPDS
jgi:hypothetical protein